MVTGAARGVGAALAHALARRGATVALLGLEEAELARVCAALPGTHAYRPVDVTDEAAMVRAAAEVTRRLGPPSVVVANAGVAEGGAFLATAPETWNRTVEVNLLGTAVTARVFLPGLLHTRGYYLQIFSLAGIAAAPLLSAYCAAESGAEAFAHSLRAEVAHRGVAVGIAYLSWTATEMIRAADAHPAPGCCAPPCRGPPRRRTGWNRWPRAWQQPPNGAPARSTHRPGYGPRRPCGRPCRGSPPAAHGRCAAASPTAAP